MVSVHVWPTNPFLLNIGHGSIKIGDEYISCWPDKYRSYKEDLEEEGRRHFIFDFNNLDEKKMLDWWFGKEEEESSFKVIQNTKKTHSYNLVVSNCCTVVGYALFKGGAIIDILPYNPQLLIALCAKISLRNKIDEIVQSK